MVYSAYPQRLKPAFIFLLDPEAFVNHDRTALGLPLFAAPLPESCSSYDVSDPLSAGLLRVTGFERTVNRLGGPSYDFRPNQ